MHHTCNMYRLCTCTIVMHHVLKLTTHHTMTPLPSGYVFMNYVVTTCHGVMLQYLISIVSGLSSVSTTTMLISFGKVKLSLCILGLHCVLLSQTLASSNISNLHVYCFVLRTTDGAKYIPNLPVLEPPPRATNPTPFLHHPTIPAKRHPPR